MATVVSTSGQAFEIDGEPTYHDRMYKGYKIEGLLMNSRMVQAIFDDENPETRLKWRYPDTNLWDPERNTDEFVDAMESWRNNGLLAFTINFQGGNPMGYARDQPWHNNAFTSDGSLKPVYLKRMQKILERIDRLGMVVIVGYFYFGQDWRLENEAAIRKGALNATEWLLETGHRNILVEISNECDIRYRHAILRAPRVHELFEEVRSITKGGRGFLVSASFSGQKVPTSNILKASDFILVHGNGPENPERLVEMVREIRNHSKYQDQPIVFNEDDHFNFERDSNHLMSALKNYASWGYFDPGSNNYQDGYQSPPVNWTINTERKRSFFTKLKEITGV